MKARLGLIVLPLLFFAGVIVGVNMNATTGVALAKSLEKSDHNLWFLISLREQLAKNNIAGSEELIDVKIDDELSRIRRDSNLVLATSRDPTWKMYFLKISSIWKQSPPFDSPQFRSQANQDWYPEFVNRHMENRKFLESVLQVY